MLRAVNGPSLSIVLPTHNRAALVPRAVRSVLAQSDPDFQLVIVDDGSADATPQTLAAFAADPRLLLLRNDSALGPPAARNRGIRAAAGEWVAFLDDDDELKPGYVARLRAHLRANPGIGLAWTGVERVHHERSPTRSEFLRWHEHWDGRGRSAHRFIEFFALSFGVAIRRQALLDVGLFDERFRATEDIDLAMRLVAAGTPYAALPEPLLTVHMGEGASASREHRTALRLLLLKKNAAFLAGQPRLRAHYQRFAMSACYRDGLNVQARALARELLRSGRIGGNGLDQLLRYELVAPIKRLFKRRATPATHA